ncbi:MAG: branched-chain amino acid transport system ATP-binding protein [Thermoleophilaceae bacterium]|jgi:branched-chain amino acid transport system ATP-binding protein|nr:branched-chain amino acid transport system ATP-binding protein [Thermoleophilaceae bacterium]
MSPVLETTELSRRFGGVDAVAGLSMAVEEGTVLGIIGPNGAGKSTLINLITGHVKPSAGRVVVDGRDVTGRKPWVIAQERVARTFQIVKPFRNLTVRENVAIGAMYGPGHARSARAAVEEADETLERVGLAERAELTPGDLSVADARRLELAKALAMRPRLLLLDEVMAGLRPGEIEPSLELIRSLREDGVTILVVEHVMKAILAVSDEVLVMHEGRELTRGLPDEVVQDERVIEAYLGQRYAKRARGGDAPS